MGSEEDLTRLAMLVKRVSAFAIAAAGAYYFFAYGMSIIGFMFISLSISSVYGVDANLAAIIGFIVGLISAIILTAVVSGSMWRYLAGQGLAKHSGGGWLGLIGFIAGFLLAYLVAGVAPEWYPPVAWYLGLGIGFTLLTLIGRFVEESPYYSMMALSAILLLATSPMVLYLASTQGPGLGNGLASGLILVIYLVTGSYAMRKAARMFEEA